MRQKSILLIYYIFLIISIGALDLPEDKPTPAPDEPEQEEVVQESGAEPEASAGDEAMGEQLQD